MTLWERVAKSVIAHEGGYVNRNDDPGGETNWGISKRSYPDLDIAALTREDALEIYQRDYWAKIPATIPDPLRWMAFDAAVNHGVYQALDWLRFHDTVASYAAQRLRFYTSLSTWPTFGRGWTRRIAGLLTEINSAFSGSELRHADTVVMHGLRPDPVILRGEFAWRQRDEKLDVRRVNDPEEQMP